MNGIGNANSINFTATMDVSEVRNNKERWENVAKIFEQKTQKYEDTFTLSALDDGEGLLLYAQTSPEKESKCSITCLMKLSLRNLLKC